MIFEWFINVMSNVMLLKVGAGLGVIVTIMLAIMFVRKRNRDERGWKIFGKASIISFIALFILFNGVAKITGSANNPYEVSFMVYGNTVQWLYNIMIITEILSVWVIRKFE